MKRFVLVLAMLTGTLSLAQSTTSSPAPSTTVTIDNFTFSPMTIEVQRGATIKWVNKDDIPHVVASTAGVFKSRAIDTDGSFVFTFAEPGTYEYYCSVHPKMTGKIVVK
jgi:plastocyanin